MHTMEEPPPVRFEEGRRDLESASRRYLLRTSLPFSVSSLRCNGRPFVLCGSLFTLTLLTYTNPLFLLGL